MNEVKKRIIVAGFSESEAQKIAEAFVKISNATIAALDDLVRALNKCSINLNELKELCNSLKQNKAKSQTDLQSNYFPTLWVVPQSLPLKGRNTTALLNGYTKLLVKNSQNQPRNRNREFKMKKSKS